MSIVTDQVGLALTPCPSPWYGEGRNVPYPLPIFPGTMYSWSREGG